MHTSESAGGKQGCVDILESLESAMLLANSFPKSHELGVLQVTSTGYNKSVKHLNKRIVSIIRAAASRYAVNNRTTDSDSASSTSTTSVTPRDHLYEEAFETTEESLECFNAALDAARGIQDAIVQPSGALGPSPQSLKIGLAYLGKRQGGFLDIEKPQVHFPDYPIDNSHNPFVPPSSQGSSDDPVATDPTTEHVDRHLQDLFRNNSKHDGERRHPYEEEILAASMEMAKKPFSEEQTMVYGSLEETPCTMVTTEEELFNIAERLKQVSEISVDLENHSIRSFQGFTCLLQVSTRREDFVIDALKLRGSVNRALAPIFADETIVKVLHGADKDVQWLERDFGVYVVSMFDTGQAARLLKLPSAALSFLLTKYCDVTGTSKKKFQLADWRQRPLPKDMFDYARSDTHYLLYVYDRMRCELCKSDLLAEAWERSAKICRRRYSKTRYDPNMAGGLAAKHGLGFDRHQLRLLEALCRWRDATARDEDESLVYVAPLHTLFGIVRARDKARTVQGLMNHGFPMRVVPPLIYKHAEALSRLVSDALHAKLEGDGEDKHTAVTGSIKEERTQNGQKTAEEAKVDGATQHGIPKLSTEVGEKAQIQISAKRNEKRGSECTVLPEAKLQKLSKCAFFDSASESDPDSEEDILRTQRTVEKDLTGGTKETCQMKDEKSAGVKATKEDRNCREGGPVYDGRVDSEQCGDIIRSKSVFALSDSDDDIEDEEGGDRGKIKAAEVAQALTEELAEKAKELKSVDFETELDARRRERAEVVQKERELQAESLMEEKRTEAEEEFISILESARRKEGDRSRRRKRKRVREEVVETKRLEAFDYSGAMKEMKLKNDGRGKEKSFDPMEGLKVQSNKTGRSNVKRRRRGRGKSMSFRS